MPEWEAARLREAQTRYKRRKDGIHDMPLVTVARAEMAGRLSQILTSLPHMAGPTIQNPDGSFPYLPGWDGPITKGDE